MGLTSAAPPAMLPAATPRPEIDFRGRSDRMSRLTYAIAVAVLAAACQGVVAYAQQAAAPPFATTKVDGTDNVYVFRYGNHQSMFVVTSDGVIATDPIGYGRPQAVKTYVDEIKKVSGQPFKDAGAVIVAHKKAKEHLIVLKDPATVLPDETMDKKRTIKLGGTVLELSYVGLNHSDSTIVMRLPKEKILFAVDFIPVGSVPGRGMIDFYPLEAEDSMKKVLTMDWDKLIPGHPGAPNGRLGTKQDVRDQLTFLQDASAAVKAEAQAGKCWDPVEKDLKLPKYENWAGYAQNLPFVLRRYCALWGRGT